MTDRLHSIKFDITACGFAYCGVDFIDMLQVQNLRNLTEMTLTVGDTAYLTNRAVAYTLLGLEIDDDGRLRATILVNESVEVYKGAGAKAKLLRIAELKYLKNDPTQRLLRR